MTDEPHGTISMTASGYTDDKIFIAPYITNNGLSSGDFDIVLYAGDSHLGTYSIHLEPNETITKEFFGISYQADGHFIIELHNTTTGTIDDTVPIILPPLDLSTGILDISSTPPGADIYINNTPIFNTKTPSSIIIGTGTYDILLKLAGYKDWTKTNVIVRSHETTTIDAKLKRDLRPLLLFSIPILLTIGYYLGKEAKNR